MEDGEIEVKGVKEACARVLTLPLALGGKEVAAGVMEGEPVSAGDALASGVVVSSDCD